MDTVNKLYQWFWFKILMKMIPVTGDGIDSLYWRFRASYFLAHLFGGVHRILIGDSNSAVWKDYTVAKLFRKLTLTWGVGGTMASDWLLFFLTKRGLKILKILLKVEVIWNIGGNHSLKNQMGTAGSSLAKLHALFPKSWNCTIPPVHYKMLGDIAHAVGMDKTDVQYETELNMISGIVRSEWKPLVIDLYYLLKGINPDLYERDIVHLNVMILKQIEKLVDPI